MENRHRTVLTRAIAVFTAEALAMDANTVNCAQQE